jgi:hypothetical protein
MNPWLLFWAPQVHLPFGGNVAQQIEPTSSWFFDSIPSNAGDPTIEREAFHVATYGRQLGLITEVLLDLSERVPLTTEAGKVARERLAQIRIQIEGLKRRDASEIALEIEALVARLKERHGNEYPKLRERLARALAGDAL